MSWLVIRAASPSPQDQTARALELTARRGLRNLALSRPSHGSTRHELPTTYYTNPFSRGSYDAVLDLGAGGTNHDACFWRPIARDIKHLAPKRTMSMSHPSSPHRSRLGHPFPSSLPSFSPTFPPDQRTRFLPSRQRWVSGRVLSREGKHGAVRSDLASLKFFFFGSFLVGAWFVRPGSTPLSP